MSSYTSATKLYKIADPKDWSAAQASDEKLFKGGALDLNDGFFHLSTAEQVPGTLGAFYKGAGTIVLIEVDREAYEEYLKQDEVGELKWEKPPIEGDERLFPHGYSKTKKGGIPAVVDGVVVSRAESIKEDESNLGVYRTYLLKM